MFDRTEIFLELCKKEKMFKEGADVSSFFFFIEKKSADVCQHGNCSRALKKEKMFKEGAEVGKCALRDGVHVDRRIYLKVP